MPELELTDVEKLWRLTMDNRRAGTFTRGVMNSCALTDGGMMV